MIRRDSSCCNTDAVHVQHSTACMQHNALQLLHHTVCGGTWPPPAHVAASGLHAGAHCISKHTAHGICHTFKQSPAPTFKALALHHTQPSRLFKRPYLHMLQPVACTLFASPPAQEPQKPAGVHCALPAAQLNDRVNMTLGCWCIIRPCLFDRAAMHAALMHCMHMQSRPAERLPQRFYVVHCRMSML
jgi:hypothetical protein